MTLEACGGGSNHQPYERLQLDNGASYRNVVNTKHVHSISLNLFLSKKSPQMTLWPPKWVNMVYHKIDYFHWSVRFVIAFFRDSNSFSNGKVIYRNKYNKYAEELTGVKLGLPQNGIIIKSTVSDWIRQTNTTWYNCWNLNCLTINFAVLSCIGGLTQGHLSRSL